MAASRQEVYFIAIRMQLGSVRRELPMVGLGAEASRAVLAAMDGVEAQLREWRATGLVAVAQLQELLTALMKLPAELRGLQESGDGERLPAGWLEAVGVLPSGAQGGSDGPLS